MEYLSIDRIEGDIAVCETDDRKKREIPVSKIEGYPREGDVICYTDGKYRVDADETTQRRQRALKLQRQLFGKR